MSKECDYRLTFNQRSVSTPCGRAGGFYGGRGSQHVLQAEGKLAGATALKGALAPAFSRLHVTAAAGQVTLAATLTPANLIPFVMNFAPSLNIRSPALLPATFGVSARVARVTQITHIVPALHQVAMYVVG